MDDDQLSFSVLYINGHIPMIAEDLRLTDSTAKVFRFVRTTLAQQLSLSGEPTNYRPDWLHGDLPT